MKEFSIATLSKMINAAPTADSKSTFSGVSVNSRTIKQGDCFFAIKGENFDGHNYIEDAFAKGAACAVVSDNTYGENILKVGDTTQALADFAAAYRQQGNFKVVAVTGSAGKTTTRRIIYHILSQKFGCHEPEKNFNRTPAAIAGKAYFVILKAIN